jgi:uridine kinase
MSKIIAITGGSGSGKTTIAQALARRLGAGAVVIPEDDYYRCSSTVRDFDPASYNFDAPEAKEHALLCQHLALAKTGQSFDKPLYDLVTHRRRTEVERIARAKTLIVEGIHLLASDHLRALFDLKVYVDADEALRLGRRMIRDVEERGRTPRMVLAQFFTTVRPMHEKHIAPQKAFADLVVRCAYGVGAEQAAVNAAQIQAALSV